MSGDPIINIITRTSNRPSYFTLNRLSVKNQGYANVVHWVISDNPSDTYVNNYEGIKIINIDQKWLDNEVSKDIASPGTGPKSPYNLYFNKVMPLIESGWVIILDDDDTLLPNALPSLSKFLLSEKDMLLYQMRYTNGTVLPPPHMYHKRPMLGTIGSPCVCVHSSIAKQIKWDGWKCGDYRYIMKAWQMSGNKKWIKKTFINIGSANGNLGKRNDIVLGHGFPNPSTHVKTATNLRQQIIRAISDKNIYSEPKLILDENQTPDNEVIAPISKFAPVLPQLSTIPFSPQQKDKKYKNTSHVYDIHYTFDLLLEKTKKGINFSYIRYGDNDLMQCTGDAKRKILGNNKTKFTLLLQKELINGIKIKDENFIKSYNIGLSGYPKKVSLCSETINTRFLRYLKRIDNRQLYHSPYIFYYYSVFYDKNIKEFLDITIRNKKTLFFGGNDEKDINKIFGKLHSSLKTPLYSASDHIERFWKLLDDKLKKDNEIETIVFAAGQLGRVMQIRTWKKYGDKYTLIDIGSIVDIYRKGNERKYMQTYKNIIKKNIEI